MRLQKLILEEELSIFTQYVKEALIEEENMSMDEANKAVVDSFFSRMLKEDPEYVTHYDPEYWASRIAKVYRQQYVY